MKHKHIFRITLALIIVISGICAAGCGDSVSQTTLTTINDFNGINTASTKSANGLSLSLSLDSATYQPGQVIMMFVDERNTSSKMNHVPSSSQWSLNGLELGPSYPCGILSSYYPFGVAIFQGYDTSSNFSKATPLNLNEPNVIMHGCILKIGHDFAYDFKPLSDIEVLGYGNTISDLNNIVLKDEVDLKGYWTNDSISEFQHFQPGVYTVVAGDEWGALAVLHFTVTP
jgi:hypothetical protein